MFRPSALRAAASPLRLIPSLPKLATPRLQTLAAAQQLRFNSHAISNPTLANIEQRWESMPPQEQADLWMALRDRMKVDWHHLTPQEKKAAYWIAFGPHGPRAGEDPGENFYVLKWTSISVLAAVAIFVAIRAFARPPPKTMTQEWQEATNELIKEQNAEPITGANMIQSKPSGKPLDADDE